MPGRKWPLILVALATALLVFIACFMVWYHVGGGAWRTSAKVVDVKLAAPDTLVLTVTSCRGAPSVAMSRETGTDVLVSVVAFYTPLHRKLGCLDSVNVYLEEPLGDRVVVDMHSGQTFSGPLQPYARAKPQPDWEIVEVPGLPGEPGFSLQLPFGWELGKVQRGEAYVGEVIGEDGIQLAFHYGTGAWSLDPADDPEHDYFLTQEDIGGVEAKLLIPIKGSGYTGVYFSDLGGQSLSFVGENLQPNQHPMAVAVFRSVRAVSPNAADVLDHKYDLTDLTAWYESLSSVIWQVPGVWFTDLNEAKNRIEIGMQPRRKARENVEAALATADVPSGAVEIEVGCPKSSPLPIDRGQSPDESFTRTIDYSLEVVDNAPHGETVQMKLRLRNVSDEPVSLSLGGRPPHEFTVSTPDGEPVWNWKCGRITLSVRDSETLAPGEELEFTGEWEQVDNLGEPVPSGAYIVTGVLDLEHPERLVSSKVLSLIAGNACVMPSETAEPGSESEPAIQGVYSRVASLVGGSPLRPLFQHLPADRPVIDRIAHAIDSAELIQTDDQLSPNDRGRYLMLLYSDGTKLRVRQVSRCEPRSDAAAKESVGGHCEGLWARATDVWWMEDKGIVTSPELSRWWEEINKYMVPVGVVSIPKKIRAGESFDITLWDWDNVIDGDSVTVSLEREDNLETRLGTYPLSGTFQGQGTVAAGTPAGRYWLRVAGNGFSELVEMVDVE